MILSELIDYLLYQVQSLQQPGFLNIFKAQFKSDIPKFL